MHIECTNGSPTVDTLDHIPPLPVFVNYGTTRINPSGKAMLQERDELGIYHALRLRDHLHQINLRLPSSIFPIILVLMDELFPLLERLSLSFLEQNKIPLILPKAFLAPNLRHLGLSGIGLPKRLRLLTSAVSLVTLTLCNIQTSSYFRPRLLAARLQSLTQLQELSIDFSIPIPRPSAEGKLLGEQEAPVTLPSLKILRFKGVGTYLESLVAQITAPLLECLGITLFNQISLALPPLFHLINHTKGSKRPVARVNFLRDWVSVTTADHGLFPGGTFFFRVMCAQLDWQIDCAAQICNALIPALSGVEELWLECPYDFRIPTALQDGEIDGTTWLELLRPFVSVKELHIYPALTEEVSRALQLQVEEVGLNPGFLPNLQSINARDNLFTTFIDTCQVVGRSVRFSQRLY